MSEKDNIVILTDGVVILKFETDENGDEILVGVENDDEAMAVLKKYDESVDDDIE